MLPRPFLSREEALLSREAWGVTSEGSRLVETAPRWTLRNVPTRCCSQKLILFLERNVLETIPLSPFSRMSPNHLIPMRSWSSRPSHLPQTNSWPWAASTPISPNTIPTIALQTRAGRWAHSGWNLMLCNSKPNLCEASVLKGLMLCSKGPPSAISNQELMWFCYTYYILYCCIILYYINCAPSKKIWCFVFFLLFRTPLDTTSLSTATF